jgi:hypothetical protein
MPNRNGRGNQNNGNDIAGQPPENPGLPIPAGGDPQFERNTQNAKAAPAQHTSYFVDRVALMARTADDIDRDVPEVPVGYVQFVYSVLINYHILDHQADVWATQARVEANLNMYHVFGERKDADQHKILRNLYLYSYAKAYLSGTTENYRGTLCMNSGMLFGHAWLHMMLRDGSTVDTTTSGYDVYRSLVPNDSDRKANIETLRRFTDLEIPSSDELALQYSCPKLDMQFSKYENSDQKTSCIISVDDIVAGTINNCNTSKSNPLGNSCFSKDFSSIQFAYSPNVMINDINYSICPACFIYVKDAQKETDDNLYYHSFSVNKLPLFIKYHVEAISVQKPRYNLLKPFDVSEVLKTHIPTNNPVGPDDKDEK